MSWSESVDQAICFGWIDGVRRSVDMIVDGSLRGMSLGKKLMDFIHNFAAEQKIKALFLESGINNDKAHSFFEKNGFEKVSVTYIKTLSE